MKKWAWLMVLMGVIGSASGNDGEADRQRKLRVVQEVAVTFSEITELSATCARHECDRQGDLDMSALQHKVSRILARHANPQVLWRLAATCRSAAWPQNAGEERVDLPFDLAWSTAIAMLGQSSSPGALDALISLDAVVETDAGDSESLLEAIAEQRKRLHQKG